MLTTFTLAHNNQSGTEKESSSSIGMFQHSKGTNKSLLQRLVPGVGNHLPTVVNSAQHAKPLAANVTRKATTNLCASQPILSAWLQGTHQEGIPEATKEIPHRS